MKYVCIATTTTGPSPHKNDILEVTAIVEDTKNQVGVEHCPRLRFWIDKDYYKGHPATLAAQSEVFKKICKFRSKNSKFLITPDEVTINFTKFLQPHFSTHAKFEIPIPVAGFQFATHTRLFLEKFPNFKNIPFNLNVIELSNFFMDWNDSRPPSFGDCVKRSKIQSTAETNLFNSRLMAQDIIKMLRTRYSNKIVSTHSIGQSLVRAATQAFSAK